MKKLTLILAGVALLATAAVAQVRKHTSKGTSTTGTTKVVTSDGHVNLQDASLRKKHMAKKAIKHVGVKPVAGDPALKRK
ncbi:MAG: hypothetical protein M3R27_13550 [Bacteroidota bacterium]|nr:hypothetical protein [Bacteroidota bacterium]